MKASGESNLIEIAGRLREFRLKSGLPQEQFALSCEIPYSSYKRYESKASGLDSDVLYKLMKGGLNVNWLLTGEGEMQLPDPASRAYAWGSDNHVFAAKEPMPPEGFVLVPRYDVAASMGNGSVIHSEQVVDHLAFREEWVRTELSANPKNLVLISAIGDSMEPTLRAGDLLLIDRSGDGVKQDAIYAFATNGELRVKRMQLKMDGSVVVKSDNQQYEPETLTSDQAAALHIVGRVVWSGRRM